MANTNLNMNMAKSAKKDEFYTMLTDIEKEMKYYNNQFKDKVVYCNCDDARVSNFFKYFFLNFKSLGLKKLISTGYIEKGKGIVSIYNGNGNAEIKELNGNGDFCSEECIEFLKEADIVVTNPPFSLFRKYMPFIMKYNKKVCIIGNQNAITFTEIFPYIKEGKLWLGKSNFNQGMYFYVPKDFEYQDTYKFKREINGEKVSRVGGVCWFTNLESNVLESIPYLTKKYNENEYSKYDNFNAINVNKVSDIPYDYEGIIGVPITVVSKICSDGLIHFKALDKDISYKIVGKIDTGIINEYNIANPIIKGKGIYKRIAIQKVK